MWKLYKDFLLIIFISLFLLGFGKNNQLIGAAVDKNRVKTGEIFTYTVTIKGSFSSPQIILPEFGVFHIVSQQQSKSYRLKGKREEIAFTLKYYLFASKPGVFTIGEVTLKDGKKEFKSKPLTIKVRGRPLEEKKKIYPYIEKGTEI